MHFAGPHTWPSEQSVRPDTQRGYGSARARLPDGKWRSRPPNVRTAVQQWHAERANLSKENLDARTREDILYRLADICTTMIRQTATRQHRTVVGDVARSVGGALVASPVDPARIQRYFGDQKGFEDIDQLITIVTGGVAGARSSHQSRANARFEIRQSPQRPCAFTCNMGKARRRRRTRKMPRDTKVVHQ